jgi:hypothetical protein
MDPALLALLELLWFAPRPSVEPRPAPPALQVESFRWSAEQPAAAAVEVSNPYGNVLARPAEDRMLEVSAMIQRFTAGPKDFEVSVEPEGAVVEVRVRKKSGSRAVFVRDAAGRFEGRIDVTLMVPQGLELWAHATAGDVQARGLRGAVRVDATAGRVEVAATGPIQASTVSGPIRATLLTDEWDRPVVLRSRSGDIEVTVTEESSVRVRAGTIGANLRGTG